MEAAPSSIESINEASRLTEPVVSQAMSWSDMTADKKVSAWGSYCPGVVGMARLLRDTPLDNEQRLYVDSAIESAEALLTIVNDILDLGRIDAGRLELSPVDVELAAFVDRIAGTPAIAE